jgi:hypothetical protein
LLATERYEANWLCPNCGCPEAGSFDDGSFDGAIARLAKTYQLAALTPLAQLLLRTIANREGDISSAALSSAALATAQGLFTLQSFTSRLQVW